MCWGILPQIKKKRVEKAMSNDKKQNLQDTFLNSVRKTRTPLTIFLVNGVKLQGVVSWFDNFCVLLRRDGQSQLVYKHAISTIMPAQPVQLYEPEQDFDD
jgi:host factor-I protein